MKRMAKACFIALAVIAISLPKSLLGNRACKLNILRSFGLTSRVTPNQRNSLCPKITYNCCSEGDQMKMHKMWAAHGKASVKTTHKENRDALDKVKSIFLDKEKLDIPKLVKKYKKMFKPSKKFSNHLDAVVGEWSKKGSAVYKKEYGTLKKQLALLNKDVYGLRRGFLCGMCEYHNHKFINPQSLTVIYSEKFCKALFKKFSDTLNRKYAVIFRYFIILNELLYLLTDTYIIEPVEQAVYKRYALQTKLCKKKNSLKACADLCKEFNLNQYSFMWDGEKLMLEDMKIKYEVLFKILTSKKPQKVMKYNKKKWTNKAVQTYAKKESVMSKVIVTPVTMKTVKKNKYNLQFKSQSVQSYIEKKTKSHTIQIDGLDDELDSFRLYKMSEPPMDITKFMVLIEKHGIDLYREANGTNLDSTAQQILALIHAKGDNIKCLDEVIEEDVKVLLKSLNIGRMNGIINDYDLEFDRLITKKRPPKIKKRNAVVAFLSNLTRIVKT